MCRLRHVKAASRTPETEFFRDGHKLLELAQFNHGDL
jgi:hypothetical protein